MITPEDFDAEEAPPGLHFWRLRAPTSTTLFPEPVLTHVLLEHSNTLDDADLSLLTEILDDIDGYLRLAIAYVRTRVAADPAFFGLTEPKEANLAEAEIGLVDTGWYLRFAQGDLPICDPYGLLIDFVGREPTGIQDISDPEEFE